MPDPREHLRTRRQHFDRPVHHLGRHRGERDVRPRLAFAPKRTAHERRDDVDQLRLDTEHRRHASANAERPLRRVVQRQAIAGPRRDGSVRLQRIVMFRRRPVRLL